MSQKPPSGDDKSLRIFVRRGALRRFDKLKRESSHLPLAIEWDRRQTDGAAETPEAAPGETASKPDRRKAPSFTWTMADFVVGTTAAAPADAANSADPTPDPKPDPDA